MKQVCIVLASVLLASILTVLCFCLLDSNTVLLYAGCVMCADTAVCGSLTVRMTARQPYRAGLCCSGIIFLLMLLVFAVSDNDTVLSCLFYAGLPAALVCLLADSIAFLVKKH